MKRTILILILLLFTLLPISAIKKIEANPINVAFMLAQESDSAKMASICDYYGYVIQPSQEGYIIFKHPNSSIIRYSFKETSKEQPYPYVEVKSKLSSKEIDFTLTDLNFKKNGSEYVRKVGQFARSVFNCKHVPKGFLGFHKTVIQCLE